MFGGEPLNPKSTLELLQDGGSAWAFYSIDNTLSQREAVAKAQGFVDGMKRAFGQTSSLQHLICLGERTTYWMYRGLISNRDYYRKEGTPVEFIEVAVAATPEALLDGYTTKLRLHEQENQNHRLMLSPKSSTVSLTTIDSSVDLDDMLRRQSNLALLEI